MTSFTAAHRGGSGPPLVLLHGFTDTWRTWELVLDRLEASHDVVAPTLAGHAGGPPLPDVIDHDVLVDDVEAAMDDAGLATAHVAGNSLGGYLALRLAARGRARSVVALAPAGGWAPDDPSVDAVLTHFETMQRLLRGAMPEMDRIVSTPQGRRRATAMFVEESDHLTAELVGHLMAGAAACAAVRPFTALARRDGWPLDAAAITCPVRVVWGTHDRLLPWPAAAVRYRKDVLPHADWVVLDGVGHGPQLERPLETAQLILGATAG